jgi:SAM-dependent methyltransferase
VNPTPTPAPNPSAAPARSTAEAAYADRLARLGTKRWKQLFHVQAPYRWNLQRRHLGFVLDVGSGMGRNLAHLDGHGVGVDHNEACVAACRAAGLTAFTPEEFVASPHAQPDRFDALLVAHVLEHLSEDDGVALLRTYLPYVKRGGRAVLITPQEAGQRTDATHVRFVDAPALRALAAASGLAVERVSSFPFPRAIGRVFPYNESVALCRLA